MKSTVIREQIESIIQEIDLVDTISYVSICKEIDRIFQLNKNKEKFNFLEGYPVITYLVGLCIKHEYRNKTTPSEEIIAILIGMLEKYFEELADDFFSSIKNIEKNNEAKLVQYLTGMYYIAAQETSETLDFQLAEILQNFLSKFNDYFFSKLGFNVDDAILFYQKIKSRHDALLTYRINEVIKIGSMPVSPNSDESLNTEDEKRDTELVAALFGNPSEVYSFDIVDFAKNGNIQDLEKFRKYLAAFGCSFGDGDSKYDSPFEKNPFIDKPIIDLGNNRFFCPNVDALFYNLPTIFENLIKEEEHKNKKVFSTYFRIKSKFLEAKATECISRIFPSHLIHKNSKYHYQGEPREVDTLIEFDNKILIIESKGEMISPAAKRGAILSLTSDLKRIIEKAHSQGKIARGYIKSSETAVFEEPNGTKFEIKFRPGITQFFLLNVTWEPLFFLATNQKLLKSLKLFENDEYLWSVNLSDFDIVTRKFHYPSIFLHYIKQRLSAIASDSFFSSNELAFLWYYLKMGNFYPPSKQTTLETKIGLGGDMVSEITDHYTRGARSPELEIEPELLGLIKVLEETRPTNYTNAAWLILDHDRLMRKQMVDAMKTVTEKTMRDGNPSDFSLISKELDQGLSFMTSLKQTDHQDFLAICELRKYQRKITKWLGISRTISEGSPLTDFIIYLEYPFEENEHFEKLSKQFPTKISP